MRVLITDEERRIRQREAVRRYQARHHEQERQRNQAYRSQHPEKVSEWNRVHKARVRDLVRQIKLERGCIDCGYRENADALELDHVRGQKIAPVSRLGSFVKVREEMAKCEVRCANCHSIQTAMRRREKGQDACAC